jgi:hypothetical protein
VQQCAVVAVAACLVSPEQGMVVQHSRAGLASMQDRTLLAFAGLLSQRVQLLAGAVRHEKKPQEYHLVVSAVGMIDGCPP